MPSSPSPTAQVAIGIELLLGLVGLVLLWRHLTRQGLRAPASPSPALTAWSATGLDFGLLVWLVLCGGLMLQFAGMALLRQLGVDGPALQVIVGSFFQFGMLAGCLAFTRFCQGGRGYDFPRGGILLPGLATFLISIPPVFAIGLGWQELLRLAGVPIEPQEMIGLFRANDHLGLLGYMIFLAALIAPVTEELIFRAGVFRFLRTRSRIPRWSALLLSALFFGVIHGNLASCPQLIGLGFIFALAYEYTGNLAVPMLAHSLFNLNTILLIRAGIDA